jgi:hypothetical protein
MEKQYLHPKRNLASLQNEYIATKLGREDAAIRRKRVVQSDSNPDLVDLKKSEAKAAKSAKAAGEKVESIFAARRTGKKLLVQTNTVDREDVSLSRSARRKQRAAALLECIKTIL